MNRQIDRQIDREKQTVRQTDKHTNPHTDRQTHTAYLLSRETSSRDIPDVILYHATPSQKYTTAKARAEQTNKLHYS